MTVLRPYERSDLEACYAVSLATGFEGGDAAHLYRDPRLMGHIYMAPYVLLEPSLAFVVEDAAGVAGFAVGTADTVAWEARLERDWWPSLRLRYADPAEPRTPDERRARMIHRPAKTPAAVTADHPAHLHLNLLPRAQRRGLGTRLLDLWSATIRTGTHVGVNRANVQAIGFWAARGFRELRIPGERTLWMARAGRASIHPD